MNIQLKSVKALYLQLVLDDHSDKCEDSGFDYDVQFPDNSSNEFAVIINGLIKGDDYRLETAYLALFTIDENLNDKFKESKFPYVNAPAIAYPFFRAYIANILVNSGFEPKYLPSINFEKLYKDKFKSEKKSK